MAEDLLHVILSIVFRSWFHSEVARDQAKIWEFLPKLLTARAAVSEGPEA